MDVEYVHTHYTMLWDSKILRSGASSGFWKEVDDRRVFIKTDNNRVVLLSSIPAAGGGETEIHIEIGPKDFGTIIEKLIMADPRAAVLAIAKELSKQSAITDAPAEVDQLG